MILALETIDLNGSESMISISNKLKVNNILTTKVVIWKLRCNNPMRKAFVNNNIKFEEFDALILLTSEMSKYLYPYIRSILRSKDNYINDPVLWNNFQDRYIELIKERMNTESIKVKKLIDKSYNHNTLINILVNLALCVSEEGHIRLRTYLLNL